MPRQMTYPLVNFHITLENHHLFTGKLTISMTIFNSLPLVIARGYQRPPFFQVDSSADGGNFSIQAEAHLWSRWPPEHWMVKSFPALLIFSGSIISIPLFAYFRCLCNINCNLAAKSPFSWVHQHFSRENRDNCRFCGVNLQTNKF